MHHFIMTLQLLVCAFGILFLILIETNLLSLRLLSLIFVDLCSIFAVVFWLRVRVDKL